MVILVFKGSDPGGEQGDQSLLGFDRPLEVVELVQQSLEDQGQVLDPF